MLYSDHSTLRDELESNAEWPRTSWPWSLVRWMSRGYLGAWSISQAAPHLLLMPSQSLWGPFTCTAVMLPVPPTSCACAPVCVSLMCNKEHLCCLIPS